MTYFESLSSPHELRLEFPALQHRQEFIKSGRQIITKILNGNDPRLLLIVGPCSIHDSIAAKEYAIKLKKLSDEVKDNFFIVMRTYFEKPRTTVGWKGMLYDPHLNGSNDIAAGLRYSRQFLLELAELELPTATEFLDPLTSYYFGDLISWGSIGARTTASQIHRQCVSGLAMPVGFKNGTDGDMTIAINAILSAAAPHAFMGMGDHGQVGVTRTSGNADCHLVLRGGEGQPNYDSKSVALALKLLSKVNLPLRLLIDCSHDNSSKKYENQPLVFQSAINQSIAGNSSIRGILLESHLHEGNQSLSEHPSCLKYAISLTDACINWETTKQLVIEASAAITDAKNKKEPVLLRDRDPQYTH